MERDAAAVGDGGIGLDARAPGDASADMDATTSPDAARDGSALSDASMDVGMETGVPMDASTDAGGPTDASMDAGWGDCTYAGVMGTCVPVSDCIAPASMHVAGFCPGPVDIQCCVPAHDGGSATPADVLARLGACTRIGGDYAQDVGGTSNIPICQTDNVIWWTADFDVDCDGGSGATCRSDPDYLPDTSAVDSSGNPLDASTLPFIVIPLPSSRFRYGDHGISAGQVALVLYGDRMIYGIFGDAGPSAIIGEGSFAMAQALGIPSSPRTGGVDSGVTYLVFTGAAARVAHNESHAEAVSLGEALLGGVL